MSKTVILSEFCSEAASGAAMELIWYDTNIHSTKRISPKWPAPNVTYEKKVSNVKIKLGALVLDIRSY